MAYVVQNFARFEFIVRLAGGTMNFIGFFAAAFFSSFLIHFVVVQPAWGLIAWSGFTGIGFVVEIFRASRKKIKEAGKTSYNK